MQFVGNNVPSYPAGLTPSNPQDIIDKGYIDTRLGWGYETINANETRAYVAPPNTYANLTTLGPTVTLTTGTLVKVTLQCLSYISSGASGGLATMGVLVTGATSIAASDTYSNQSNTTAVTKQQSQAAVFLMTVNAGSNTFQAKYGSLTSGTTAGFDRRTMIVERMN